MMLIAADSGTTGCHIARSHGAKDFQSMLVSAARKGYTKIVELAIEWGVDDLLPAIEIATANYSEDVLKILRAERNRRLANGK